MHTPAVGSVAAQITKPSEKAATPVAPVTAGDWHRCLLRLRHDLAVDRRAELEAIRACEWRNRDYIDHLFALAEATVQARGTGDGPSLSDFIHKQPLRRTLSLTHVGDGRWIARERSCEASALVHSAELGVYPPRVVELTRRLDALIHSTSRELIALENTFGRRVSREKQVAHAEDQLRRARCSDWKRVLEKAAAWGWISFVGATVVTLATTPEVPIGAAPGGGGPISTGVAGSPAFLLIPLGFAVVATAGLLWVRRILRGSRRDEGHSASPREDSMS